MLVAVPGVRGQVRLGTEHRPALAFFVMAGLFIGVAWVAQFFALRIGSVVTTVPLINTFPLVIAVVSYLLAREVPRSPRSPRSPRVLAGIAAIVVGASVMELL